jgi:hypothetical protein
MTAENRRDPKQEEPDRPRRGPSDAQLEAAIEGLNSGVGNPFGLHGERAHHPVGRSGSPGSGNPMGGGGLGISTSGAGPGEQPDNPAAETGGPRGAGTSVSATSGGHTAGGVEPVRNPEELIRERTSRPVEARKRAKSAKSREKNR